MGLESFLQFYSHLLGIKHHLSVPWGTNAFPLLLSLRLYLQAFYFFFPFSNQAWPVPLIVAMQRLLSVGSISGSVFGCLPPCALASCFPGIRTLLLPGSDLPLLPLKHRWLGRVWLQSHESSQQDKTHKLLFLGTQRFVLSFYFELAPYQQGAHQLSRRCIKSRFQVKALFVPSVIK